jgi:pimeloyl-ACP methyl ester carboxylesterase
MTPHDGQIELLPTNPPFSVRHRFADVNGIRLHYVEADPPQGTAKRGLCLALHGFPEFWYSWRHQLPALANAGFHVLAPDLRGYNLSDKPQSVSAYCIKALLGDVLGLINHAGAERATIIGHDWGGFITWHLAMRHPQVVEKLIVLNAPHPAAFRRELHSWRQLLKSWYMLFFQAPGLAEWVLGAGDFEWIARVFRQQPVNGGAFSPEDVRRYQKALAKPGALTAGLNYYRALRYPSHRAARMDTPIRVPVLLLWGERDAYATPRLTEGLDAWVADLSVVRFLDVSHWIQNDAPERVNRLIIEFLQNLPALQPAYCGR